MALTRRRHTHNKTRKHAKPSGSYIYLKGRGGLNDNLVQLAACTKYAMKHHRSIIVEFTTYTAADIDTVFDFSKYPVPIYTNFKEKARELKNHPLEPACIDSLQGMPKYATLQSDGFHDSKGHILRFDLDRSYPSDTVLVYASGGGGGGDDAVNILEHVRLRPPVLEAYQKKLTENGIPEEYISIHLRATDRKLKIDNNIAGMLLKDSNAIINAPTTGNQHRDSLRKIRAFIKAHPTLATFVAGDNQKLIGKLQDKYPSILASDSSTSTKPLHASGKTDPDNLRNAIVDLLILAGAKAIMTSQGGYSRLAKKLMKRPDILEKLLQKRLTPL